MEKGESLQKVALVKLGRYKQKNKIRIFSDTMHRNKLKMDLRPKYKADYYENLNRKLLAEHSLT